MAFAQEVAHLPARARWFHNRRLALLGDGGIQEGRERLSVGDEAMVELPTGDVKERRRGGAGVLATLLIDARRLASSGYIRVERPQADGFVGQIGLRRGTPMFCIAESGSGALQTGMEAYHSCEAVSALDDARLSVHSDVDIDTIAELHPYARLLESEVGPDESPWWSRGLHAGLNEPPSRIGGWARIRSEYEMAEAAADPGTAAATSNAGASDSAIDPQFGPPVEPATGSSESIPPAVPATMAEDSAGERFDLGTSWSLDDSDSNAAFAIARGLAARGSPLLVISRVPPERIRSEHGLPETVVRWLSETPGDPAGIAPHLEVILREVEDFLFANTRAVCLLDGLEFLAALHGFDRTIVFVHDLADMVAATDDLLLCPVDLLAWSSRERALLTADLISLPSSSADLWASRPELMEGHPFLESDVEQPESRPVVAAVGRNDHDAAAPPASTDTAPSFSMSGLISTWREETGRAESPSNESGTEADGAMAESAVDEPAVGAIPSDITEAPAFGALEEPLPAWATQPSPNRMDVFDGTLESGRHEEQVPERDPVAEVTEVDIGGAEGPVEESAGESGDEPADVSGPGSPVSAPEESDRPADDSVGDAPTDEMRSEAVIASEAVESEPPGQPAEPPVSVMRRPTVDHSGRGRGIRRTEASSDAELHGLGLAQAATSAGDSTAVFQPSGPDLHQGGLAVAQNLALDSPVLGSSVETPLDLTGIEWAVNNARVIGESLPGDSHEEIRRTLSKHSPNIVLESKGPSMTDNPLATQRSAVAQRQSSNIRMLERIDYREDEGGEQIYERVGALVDAGIDVGDLMTLLELDRSAGRELLTEMEEEE